MGTMSSSSTSPPPIYDVFVSFEGVDVKETFILNLFKRLKQLGINHFEDDDNEGDAKTNKKRLEAISNARFALVVLSENYVKSQARQNELVKIFEHQEKHRFVFVVIPIFHMDRDKISNSGSKGDALAKAKLISGYYELKAANNESKLIEKIVERLCNLINSQSEKIFTFGPSGGRHREEWKSGGIKGIRVCYAYFIKSIDFGVRDNTKLKPDITYDEETGEHTFQVTLKEGEHLTSFAGYLGEKGINSLTFRTNKRTLEPINAEKKEGEYFYVPSKAVKVDKIFVISNGFLQSIGAALVKLPSEVFRPVKYVPLLTNKCQPKWDDGDMHKDVSKIIVKHGEGFIRSIELCEKKSREVGQSETDGGMVRSTEVIEMNQNEYLTSISGKYTEGGIKYLTFRTNKNMIRTIGDGEAGTPFSSPATDGKIVGFYEWSEESSRGIGAYLETWPSKGENAWDDGKFDGVREIRGFVEQNIRYIKFVYDDGSEKGRTVIHGDSTILVDSCGEQEVKLEDYPREYLTWIFGSMGADGSISSLTFYSNRGGLGSIGVGRKPEPNFSYPSTGSRIIGFYGTGGNTLNSIGVHAEPIPHLYPFKTIGPFGGSGEKEWDDGVHTAVRGFRVIVDSPGNIIQSISFRYDFNGSLVECLRPGGGDAPSGEWVVCWYLDLAVGVLQRKPCFMVGV